MQRSSACLALVPMRQQRPDRLCPRGLRQLVNTTDTVIFERFLEMRRWLGSSKYITPVFKKSQKDDSGNRRQVNFTSIPGNFMEQIPLEQVLLEAMSRQMEKTGENSQHGLTSSAVIQRHLNRLQEGAHKNLMKLKKKKKCKVLPPGRWAGDRWFREQLCFKDLRGPGRWQAKRPTASWVEWTRAEPEDSGQWSSLF